VTVRFAARSHDMFLFEPLSRLWILCIARESPLSQVKLRLHSNHIDPESRFKNCMALLGNLPGLILIPIAAMRQMLALGASPSST